MLLFLLTIGCGAERGQRPAEAEVAYSGWVYSDPTYADVLGEGELTFTLPDLEPVSATQPYANYPGYWQATLPASTPFTLRVEGEGAYPSVWAGDTPGADGSWLQGALFAAQTAYVDELLAGLAQVTGEVGSPADGAVMAWGLPRDGSDWDCAAVKVSGATPLCVAVDDETGTMRVVTEGPFDQFFAFDLAPGVVVVDDGFGGEEAYPAEAGDVVLAFWWEHA